MIFRNGDTIAAVATAPGRGGIGIVRISGPKIAGLAEALTRRKLVPRLATRSGFIAADGNPIDEGIALWFPGPASYTGEDVLELHGHGGPVVMDMLLRRCIELGARLAEPGEFTYRAFHNDKIDLAQAEGVADIIEAATEAAARSAVRSLRGDFSIMVNDLVGRLIELRTLVEATLDFPEEEIGTEHRIGASTRLRELKGDLHQILRMGQQGSILRKGLHVVLAGQPNVGKSSLLNRLAGQELAIVTPQPGTTRDTVRQVIEVEGVPVHIIDTAGLREPVDEVEAIGIQRTWDAIASADLLLLVVDARLGMTAVDEDIVKGLAPSLKRLPVFNKQDLLDSGEASVLSGGDSGILISAKSGHGIGLLKKALLEHAGWQPSGEDALMARERHLFALRNAAGCIDRAETLVLRLELFAEELRLAQESLSNISGEYCADDLLGEIFSRFCIGK